MAKCDIEKKLERMYLEAYKRLGNSTWVVNEMKWKIFVVYERQLERLDTDDQWIVRNYIGSLEKLHGGE